MSLTERRRSELIGALGTVIEWYDFGLYIYLAPVYGRVFFPSDDPRTSLLASFAVFAVAYLARPVGAIVFGQYGDRRGRRASLTISAAIIGAALVVNGLLPGYSTIGLLAPLLLIACRLATGFAVGGEYSGILVYLLETASVRHRGFVASWSPAVAGIGSLLAVGLTTVITGSLSTAQLDSWGWRIPVLFGAALAWSIYLLRRHVAESPVFENLEPSGNLRSNPLRHVLRHARKAIVVTFALSAVGSVAYFLNITYIPTLLHTFLDVDAHTALLWSTVATGVMVVFSPAFGAASDSFGRRRTLLIIGLAIAVSTPALFVVLDDQSAVVVVVAMCALALGAGAWSAAAASTIPEQFHAAERFTGVAIGYNLAVGIFGGLTPLLATLLIDWTDSRLAAGIACSVITLVGLLALVGTKERARRPLD